MARTCLFIFKNAPYSSQSCKEGIDALLAASAFGIQCSVLFIDEGVWQLYGHQTPELLGLKNTQAMLNALEMYDIDTLLVHQPSLSRRGITPGNLSLKVQLVDSQALALLFAQHDLCLSF